MRYRKKSPHDHHNLSSSVPNTSRTNPPTVAPSWGEVVSSGAKFFGKSCSRIGETGPGAGSSFFLLFLSHSAATFFAFLVVKVHPFFVLASSGVRNIVMILLQSF